MYLKPNAPGEFFCILTLLEQGEKRDEMGSLLFTFLYTLESFPKTLQGAIKK